MRGVAEIEVPGDECTGTGNKREGHGILGFGGSV